MGQMKVCKRKMAPVLKLIHTITSECRHGDTATLHSVFARDIKQFYMFSGFCKINVGLLNMLKSYS